MVDYPYGRSVFQQQPLTYVVFEPEDGDILKGMLFKNRQPWYQHAAWIILGLTDALALVHSQGKLHLTLSPEAVLVRFDQDEIPRPKLLDLGAVSAPEQVANHWSRQDLPAAYIAPELLSYPRRPSRQTDVYGLGLLFYEMLAGQPAYQVQPVDNSAGSLNLLESGPVMPIDRPDLKPEVIALVTRAIAPEASTRFANMNALGEKLMAEFPQAPAEKKGREINWQMIGLGVLLLLFIALILTTAIFLAG